MRSRTILPLGLVLLLATIAGIATISWTVGQTPPQSKSSAPAASQPPVTPHSAAPASNVKPAAFTSPEHDLARMSPFARQIYLSAQYGADWLRCVQNPVSGRFTYGLNPALNTPIEGEHFLHQAGATLALVRAARYFGEERYGLRAKQAILSLMAETQLDPNDKSIRYTGLPSIAVNRLAAAALLLLAIHELPNPADDLVQLGEELAHFIRRQQRADGSLRYTDGDDPPNDKEHEVLHTYPGLALYSLMASQKRRPAAWKLDVVRKALPYSQAWWKARPSSAFVLWQSAAFTEAYLQTREPAFAAFVFEMNDWICSQQFVPGNTRQPAWVGGFRNVPEKPFAGWDSLPPNLESAAVAEGLVQACRITRRLPDMQRYERYRAALDASMSFLM
ncbi:MAG TPA: hypothetical protein VGZ47_04460, partial [Gemmataceae bacterium]|nr:hypothetical protein [Gemmataceae bacterium]